MSTPWGRLRRRILGIRTRDMSFERRGFPGANPAMRARLERIVQAFVAGYHAALEDDRIDALGSGLSRIEPELAGFANEGTSMALALLDGLTPWRRHRVRCWIEGPGAPHVYMAHVGVGWALARLPANLPRQLARLDPLLRWLAIDGYGFHEGFFHWPRHRQGQPAPRQLTGYARRAFDQGLGRCLWFIQGGEVAEIAAALACFPAERHADLWSGLGLAAVYAGEVNDDALRALRASAADCAPQLAQGAAFAAKARLRAGTATAYTDQACQVLCGRSAESAARLTDEALRNLPSDGPDPAYEIWRQRIQEQLR